MDDRRFEYALRDLLIRDGWPAHRVGGGGDQTADVIGDIRSAAGSWCRPSTPASAGRWAQL